MEFLIWTHGEELFLNDLNQFHLILKFMYETSQNSVTFLDLNVSLKDSAIFTDLTIKPTNDHQFLHYKLSHPSHKINLIPYSYPLEISKLFSSRNIPMSIFQSEGLIFDKELPSESY